MKYILFEKSAVELMINNPALQSMEFPASEKFVNFLREKSDDFLLKDISHRCEKEGIIFCGKEATKTFLLFDLEKCKMIEKTDDSELLIVLQKTFRFAVRFWNRQAFTNCEKIFKNKTVIFPFPFSIGSAYRIVLERNPSDRRLNIRGINNCLLAYKYGEEGASSSEDENPDLSIYRKGGESYLEHIQELRREIIEQKSKYESKADDSDSSIHVYLSNNMISSSEFKYMNYEKQVKNLTTTQSSIVNCQDMNSPIRIEGPAGTGKTAALVLRAIKLLSDAEKNDKELFITFFTHSKSTESIVTQMIAHLAKPDWLNLDNLQRINGFINPYKYCESSFTAREEEMCEIPQLLMYKNDTEMKESLEKHIKKYVNKYKCQPCEIALVFFDEEMLLKNYTQFIGKYSVNYINGRKNSQFGTDPSKVICTLPEYINGLEFKCVILVAVDEGRVPQNGLCDISSSFLKYSALNKLYLSCSRAQYSVLILGNKLRGISSCLQHSLAKGALTQSYVDD